VKSIDRRAFLSALAAVGAVPAIVRCGSQAPAPAANGAVPSRQLLGGWRIAEEFARGAIAIDFARMKLWMIGHAQRNEVLEYDLPAMGSGSDVEKYPRVDAIKRTAPWWTGGYANGLILWKGKLWAAPRTFYDITPPDTLTLFAQDGEQLTLKIPRQIFSGFVKRGPGMDPLIGCGGYESGQGSSSGPSLATLDGKSLIQFGWPAEPGSVGSNGLPANWNRRAPREPNYSCDVDSWVAWKPRTINGMLQGRWASDCIYGGGLVLPEGITYWAYQGTGDLNYGRQRPTFAAGGMERTYEYRYNASTYGFNGYFARPDLGYEPIVGQELAPDGKLFLAHGNQWKSAGYTVDVALKVYG
jgi:hypothetical protein